jgi:hypothetical protein
VQLVGAQHVLLRLARGEHDDGDGGEVVVGLDLGQHLAPVLAREVEVEQDQVRPRGSREVPVPAQEVDRLDAVGDAVQPVADLVVGERLLDEDDIARVVLDEQDVYDLDVLRRAHEPGSPLSRSGGRRARRREA